MDAETLSDRVLVCGGRTYADLREVARVLDLLQPKLTIHGDALGADTLADGYANMHGIPKEVYTPDRNLDGRGWDWKFNRNTRMLVHGKPTLVVAFPGTRGTADTVRKARENGIPVIEVKANAYSTCSPRLPGSRVWQPVLQRHFRRREPARARASRLPGVGVWTPLLWRQWIQRTEVKKEWYCQGKRSPTRPNGRSPTG